MNRATQLRFAAVIAFSLAEAMVLFTLGVQGIGWYFLNGVTVGLFWEPWVYAAADRERRE